MTAGRYDIVCEQGATLSRTLLWEDENGDPVDLTDCSAWLQVRRRAEATAVLLELDSGEIGGITLGGVAGTIAIEVSEEDTAELEEDGVYDLLVTDTGGTVHRVVAGRWIISHCVTRENPEPEPEP